VFFATWCVPCRLELVVAQRFADKHRAAGLEVLAVSVDGPETAADIPAMMRRYGIRLPRIRDRESALLTRYHPAGGVPFSVLLDGAGKVVFARAGFEPGDERVMAEAIAATLAPAAAPDNAASTRLVGMFQTLGVYRRTAFHPQTDARVRGGVARVLAGAKRGGWAAGLRVDGVALDHERAGTLLSPTPERAYVAYRSERLRARLGDTHIAVGEGLALSLRRVDTLGNDIALRGGRLDLGDPSLGLRLYGGVVNAQNLDPIQLNTTPDHDDRLAGAVASTTAGRFRLAAHAMAVRTRAGAPDGADIDQLLGGLHARARFADTTVTCDSAVGRTRGQGQREQRLIGLYCRAVALIGKRWVLTFAHKDYKGLQIGRPTLARLYHEPPTLERADQVVPDNRDAFGQRLRVDFRPVPWLSVYANALHYGYGRSPPMFADRNRVLHAYAGVEARQGKRATAAVSGGWRRDNKPDGTLKSGLWHVDLDASAAITPAFTVAGQWNHRGEVAVAFTERAFVRGQAVIGLAMVQRVVVSALYGYTSEKAALPFHYPGAELKVYLPRGGEVRLFGGRMAGGRLCVSGTCRDVPAFEGARLDAVLRW